MNSSVRSTADKAPKYETVKLTASDIEGAQLDEPFDNHAVALLWWWCCGVELKCLHTSWEKSELIAW